MIKGTIMFKPKKITIAILSATLLPLTASAVELAPVHVVTDAELSQKNSTATQNLLETGNTETGTALRQINGVEAARMGGHGLDLNIRGQKESQLNIIIDGAKIEGGCPNRMDPPTSYAELSSFDEVTVVKGVKSVTYGTGGSGGTVLFERNAPSFSDDKPYKIELNAGTANNGLKQDMNATLSAGGKQGYIVLQGSKKVADNYKDGNGDEVRSSYETRQARVDLGWTPNKNHELGLSHENVYTEDALFDGAMMDAPLSDGTTTRLNYEGKNISSAIQRIQANIYQSDVDHLMDNYSLRDAPEGPANPMMFRENETDVKTTGAKIELSSQIGHTELTYGAQFESIEKLADLRRTDGTTLWAMWPDVTSETRSFFAEATSLFRNNQKVILGLRHDTFNAKAADADSATAMGTPSAVYNNIYQNYSGDTETSQAGVNAVARYERVFDNGISYYAGLSRTHRFADATELYIVKGGSWLGNPDLDPEQHNQLDFGIAGKTHSISWAASVFYDRVHNYILRDKATNQSSTNGTGEVYVNKNATIRGIETDINYQMNAHIDIGINLSALKGTNDSDSRNLSNIAPLSGNIHALYTASNWDAGARWNFAKDQTEVNEEYMEIETAGWSTLDLFANYQVNKAVRLSAGVDNVFDRGYQTFLNRVEPTSANTYKIYEPGRVAWVKLNAKF